MNNAIAVGVAAFLALSAAALGQDDAFRVHFWIIFVVLSLTSIVLMRRVTFLPADQILQCEGSSRALRVQLNPYPAAVK
jgi:hypothetical protein